MYLHFLTLSWLCALETFWRARGVERLGQQKPHDFLEYVSKSLKTIAAFLCLSFLPSRYMAAGTSIPAIWVEKHATTGTEGRRCLPAGDAD